jgi:hypothetical protein
MPVILREVFNLDRHMYLVKFSDGATTFVFPDEVEVALQVWVFGISQAACFDNSKESWQAQLKARFAGLFLESRFFKKIAEPFLLFPIYQELTIAIGTRKKFAAISAMWSKHPRRHVEKAVEAERIPGSPSGYRRIVAPTKYDFS